jgi:transcriptional regulator with GAF, ATPase, and Fis domain
MALEISKLVEQFSLHIITSSDPEKSLITIYQFLKKHFPLNLLNAAIYDAQHGIMHYRIGITDEGVMLVDEKVKLSSTARILAQDELKKPILNIASTNRHPVTHDISNYFSTNETASSLSATKKINASRYLLIGLIAWGEGLYKETHVQLLKGLFDALTGVIQSILHQLEIDSEKNRLITEKRDLRKRVGPRIIGEETGLREVMSQIDRVAPLDIPVLLMGETGVGKEIIANAIHQRSQRATQPFVSINCGAIPDTLLESELFGYEKGAFTGATETKNGYFEQADHGNIFMDEIGELSSMAQVKLLRCLQTMKFHRVGGKRPISVDVRVIAATNRDLKTLAENGQFRKDLWYRLNVFPIYIPPLRERKLDIPELALYFARIKSNEMNLPHDFSFAPESMEQLQDYHWPGNIRELQNVIERKLIISQGKPLSFFELTETRTRPSKEKPSSTSPGFPTMDEVISQHIRKCLLLSKGRVEGAGGAAELLGINPSTLRGRMRKCGIKIDRMLS